VRNARLRTNRTATCVRRSRVRAAAGGNVIRISFVVVGQSGVRSAVSVSEIRWFRSGNDRRGVFLFFYRNFITVILSHGIVFFSASPLQSKTNRIISREYFWGLRFSR